jgi:hypothetical protein
MDRRYTVAAVQAVASVFAMVAITWGIRYDWPDYVHVKYGLPLTWGVHTLATIAGPADTWSVNLTALAINLAIWLGLMFLLSLLVAQRRGSRA